MRLAIPGGPDRRHFILILGIADFAQTLERHAPNQAGPACYTDSSDLGGYLDQDEHGFLLEKSDGGVLPAGCIKHPTEVAESVRDATGAALRAIKWTRG